MLRRHLFGLIPLPFLPEKQTVKLSKEGELCWNKLLKEFNHFKKHWPNHYVYLDVSVYYYKNTDPKKKYQRTRFSTYILNPYNSYQEVIKLYGRENVVDITLNITEVKEIEKRFEQLQNNRSEA